MIVLLALAVAAGTGWLRVEHPETSLHQSKTRSSPG
jgi:hypothetical protein